MSKSYRIGELSKLTRVSKRTIDFYTQLGLLKSERTDSNRRLYPEETLERMKIIEMYKKEKLSLVEIQTRFKVLDEMDVSKIEVAQKLHHISEQLRRLEDSLLECKLLLSGFDKSHLKNLTAQITVQFASVAQIMNEIS
ncbi:MerR family transcriptional regulator [Effusibacillus dendaii]|uniref:Transcriptional regulator n=1 Tax=Effusibacillus dendaii TaxID=2743772 RepID=A0A7I8DHL7_9BACL|nr:MerR family transcriptional regulator [Effusibacillus dendaii]BCJ88406.1 transcriptional regulator [Effusibacillus dendaii]